MTTRTGVLKSSLDAPEINWEAIYSDLLPRVYNFFRYRFGDGQQAEDLTALTFEKAWRARERYRRDIAAFSTWLFTIARNVGADYVRDQQVEISLDELREQPANTSTEELVQKRVEFERLEVLLARLPERESELIALKYGAGLTNREIAQLTHLSESNVGTILYRVVHTLRSQWEAKP